MSYLDGLGKTNEAAVSMCGQQIDAALLVVKSPEDKGLKGLANTGSLGKKLKTMNYLALTATHLRLFALGGRNGLKPKSEIAAWERGGVMIEVQDVVRSSYFASTGSSMDFPVHALRLTSPGVELYLDVPAADPDDAAVLGPGPGLEITAMLQQIVAGAITRPT